MTPQTETWLSVRQVAARLGISPRTVYRAIEGRQLIAHRVGARTLRVAESALAAWLSQSRLPAPQPAAPAARRLSLPLAGDTRRRLATLLQHPPPARHQ